LIRDAHDVGAVEDNSADMALAPSEVATLAAVRGAAELIRPHVRRTPALPTDLDPRLLLKADCLQRTGSFKVRGAFNAVLRLDPASTRGVVTGSSGNHAQAVALAARTAGLPALILIPENANPLKIAATRALGAEVISEGVTMENRDAKLAALSEERGFTVIHPYDNWDVIHGQGTAALELIEDAPDLAAVAVPVGGGGMLSGWAIAAKGLNPGIAVIGVEPELADDARRTLESRHVVRLEAAPKTMADGVRTLGIGQRNFEVIVERGLVDAIVTVSEAEIAEAARVAWLRCKLAVEPTGALPLAAFLAGKLPTNGRLGLQLSGGNADPRVIVELLGAAST
jgi:threonine dehydratase